ncbi:MAG: hypothetical protein J7521_20205 [Caulobacter sp.]|nr:hypothetical protein [Caulobacter sp.]
MTSFTKPNRPLLFWHVGGEIVMQMEPGPFAIDTDAQRFLLEVLDDEAKSARAAGDTDGWLAALDKAHQLTEARIQAQRWARASGCLTDLDRRAA